ncbi:MAG TPA: sodium:solute symporter family protein [Rhodanobacteraceae bacterium]|nr:sodium:solute symporter family protein [Rhodanobacteraceae bacterium]
MNAAIVVFVVLFGLVTVLGFVAARWRAARLDHLEEWGLAGRRFGTVVTWFLLGGDLYTAYTFVAVPALVFGAGALGFFAMPYTLIVYPFVFVVFPRLWSVAKQHGYVTGGDFVRARYGSRTLALLVALTGILATMPYIALQLVGMEVVIGALGLHGQGWLGELPLIIAFAILAAYTYTSGLRAPAMIAVVKDVLIYITVIAAVVVIPGKLGGYAKVFEAVPADRLLLQPGQASAYATLALGSALALFLYPHAITGILSADSRRTIKRNMALLPAYSLVLALISALGYMALASNVAHDPAFAAGFDRYGPNYAVPALFLRWFPSWFVGVAMAAIAIGALVPAAIMSIAAANLYTRNIHREYLRPDATPAEEARVAKMVSLLVKFGALAFVLLLPQKFAIQLQLLGGIWIIQTLPAIVIGLYTRKLHSRALIAGWLVGMVSGTWMAASQHFKAIYPLHLGDLSIPGYAALYALVLNLLVTLVLSAVAPRLGWSAAADQTAASDYSDATEAS